jgi:hypothetical protein
MDPDPAIFALTFKMPKKNDLKKFFCLLLFEGTFTSFFKDKKIERSHKNSKNQGRSYYFLDNRRVIEGSGYTPLTNGSGSGRPKNMWIRNTVNNCGYVFVGWILTAACFQNK